MLRMLPKHKNIMSNSPLPLRLCNPYSSVLRAQRENIMAWVSAPDHYYIVRGVLAGEYGAVQSILSIFWQKFVSQVRDVEKIPDFWNLDNKNPERLARILARLNFEDINSLHSALAEANDHITSLTNDLATLRSQRSRRPNPRPTKPKNLSVSSNGKRKRAGSSSPKVPHASSIAEGSEGNGNGHAEAEAQSERKEARQQSTEPS